MEKFTLLIFLFFASVFGNVSSGSVPAIFTFGDSIFDAGNNHFNPNCSVQADFPPYGRDFFHHPTGRFTNGRTVADFICELLGIDLQKPYLQVDLGVRNGTLKKYPDNGINFASAGSGLLNDTNSDLGVMSISTQLQQFEALVKQKKIHKKKIEQAFFFLESGSNDVFQFYFFSTPEDKAHQFVKAMVGEVREWARRVYELGARRIAIFGLGPVGCVPARVLLSDKLTKVCHPEMNRMVEEFNSGVEGLVLEEMPANCPRAHAVYGATYKTILNFRHLPKHYGFTNTTSACCGEGSMGGMGQCGIGNFSQCENPNEFLFWDFFHPTEHAYKLLTKAFWGGKKKRIRPFNLITLANISSN